MIFRRRSRPINWSRDPQVMLDVKEVGAARAMYVNEETQLVMLQFATTDGQIVKVELTTKQTATLIEQMTQAYYAIVPQLRTRRNLN